MGSVGLDCNDGGQCSCKTFVEGLTCDVCKDSYYQLSAGNPDGCLACLCDAGGSVSAVCNKQSGLCSCNRNILNSQDRTCGRRGIAQNFYFELLHSIRIEVEEPAVSDQSQPWGFDSRDFPAFTGRGYAILQPEVSC